MGQAYLDGKYRLNGVLYLDGNIPDREAHVTASTSLNVTHSSYEIRTGQAVITAFTSVDTTHSLYEKITGQAFLTASSLTDVSKRKIGKGEATSVFVSSLLLDGTGVHTILAAVPVTAVSAVASTGVKGGKKEIDIFALSLIEVSHYRPVVMTLFGEQDESVVNLWWEYEPVGEGS